MKLELEDLRVTYAQGSHSFQAVAGVSLQLEAGKTVGIVGESGSGKTTLGKAIVGMAPFSGGRMLLDGEDISAPRKRTTKAFRQRVQMVFQDPFSSFNPRLRMSESIGEVLSRSRFPNGPARRREALRIVELVGLPESSLDRYPHQFSGGQLQRLAIGRALAVEPEVVIHDEVTSGLDVSVQAKALNLLRELQGRLGLSYLFISHDLSTVRYMSDVVIVMYLGKVMEAGPVDDVFDRPQHPYTRTLIESLPEIGRPRRPAPLKGDLPDPANPPSGCPFRTRCPIGPLAYPERTICVTTVPEERETETGTRAACHFVGRSLSLGMPTVGAR